MTAALRPADLAAAWPVDLLDLPLLVTSSVDSTQRLARTILDRHLEDDEEPPRTFLVALEQAAGRGRRDRPWKSGAGQGLWATLLAPVAESELATLPIRLGLAAAAAIEPFVPSVRVKWPNDLVVDGRKLGGLLVEAVRRGEGRSWVICGLGLNVDPPEGEDLEDRAASIRAAADGRAPGLEELVAPIASALHREILSPAADWRDAFVARSAQQPGDRVRVELDGGESVEGAFAGLDERGAALLDTDSGRRVVTSGDLYAW